MTVLQSHFIYLEVYLGACLLFSPFLFPTFLSPLETLNAWKNFLETVLFIVCHFSNEETKVSSCGVNCLLCQNWFLVREKRHISCAEERQIIYAASYPSRKGHNPYLPLRCGLCLVVCFPRVQCGKEGERSFPAEKPDQWSRSASAVLSHVSSVPPWWDVMKMALHLPGLPPQENSYLRDILQSTWPVVLKTVKAIKNKESLRDPPSPEEAKETWRLDVTWCRGQGPGTEVAS